MTTVIIGGAYVIIVAVIVRFIHVMHQREEELLDFERTRRSEHAASLTETTNVAA